MFATRLKKLFVSSALVGIAASLPTLALAQASSAANFPNKPIKLLVGFAPGGGTDAAARTIAIKLTEILGQTVVVDNKPGAGGNISADMVAKAQGDGYTIGLANIGSLAVNPQMPNGTPYNTLKDFAMLGNGVSFGNVLVVRADSDIKTFAEYLVAAKSADKPLFYGSSGFGSAGHLSGELLKQRANTTAQHINYKGGGPAMNGLLGGEIQAIFASAPTAIPLIKAGKLRALAVTGSKRAADLPDVPTIAELGFPGYLATNWYSFIAPANTPPAIVQKLNAAIVSAINDQATLARLTAQGMDPDHSTSEEMRAFVTKEYDIWGKVARTLKF
jgi:tripartite-type tricarboxylate transporter receptor subunit TctC